MGFVVGCQQFEVYEVYGLVFGFVGCGIVGDEYGIIVIEEVIVLCYCCGVGGYGFWVVGEG